MPPKAPRMPQVGLQTGPLALAPPKGRRSAQTDPDARRLAATQVMVRRLNGESVQDIADSLGVHRSTVHERIKEARRDGVPSVARAIFISDMLPSAMAVIEEALAGTDMKLALSAAKMVIDGLDAIKPPPGSTGAGEETFELFRERFIVRRPIAGAIDGETVEAGASQTGAQAGGDDPQNVQLLGSGPEGSPPAPSENPTVALEKAGFGRLSPDSID